MGPQASALGCAPFDRILGDFDGIKWCLNLNPNMMSGEFGTALNTEIFFKASASVRRISHSHRGHISTSIEVELPNTQPT